VKVVPPLLFGSLLLIAAVVRFAPKEWMWPAIGTVAFFAIFISTRIAARAIGEETEKRFKDR